MRHPRAVERATAAKLAASALGACALVAAVDPDGGGPYPTCPTRALLGVDCPVCGTLRGTHALLRGRVAEALDHNLLLLVAVPLAVVAWLGWVATAAGRRTPWHLRIPAWGVWAVAVLALAYAVARNLPVDALGGLASDA
jgi:hypothetical protein